MSEPNYDTLTDECEGCQRPTSEVGDLEWYDNGITCDGAWLCGDCIGTAEMEL